MSGRRRNANGELIRNTSSSSSSGSGASSSSAAFEQSEWGCTVGLSDLALSSAAFLSAGVLLLVFFGAKHPREILESLDAANPAFTLHRILLLIVIGFALIGVGAFLGSLRFLGLTFLWPLHDFFTVIGGFVGFPLVTCGIALLPLKTTIAIEPQALESLRQQLFASPEFSLVFPATLLGSALFAVVLPSLRGLRDVVNIAGVSAVIWKGVVLLQISGNGDFFVGVSKLKLQLVDFDAASLFQSPGACGAALLLAAVLFLLVALIGTNGSLCCVLRVNWFHYLVAGVVLLLLFPLPSLVRPLVTHHINVAAALRLLSSGTLFQ